MPGPSLALGVGNWIVKVAGRQASDQLHCNINPFASAKIALFGKVLICGDECPWRRAGQGGPVRTGP